MGWVSDIAGGAGDAVSSLVSGVESMFGAGASSSGATGSGYSPTDDVLSGLDLSSGGGGVPGQTGTFRPMAISADTLASNPLNGPAPDASSTPPAGSVRPSPIYQGALATGALRLLGGVLAPNPMAMQINAQDTWTKQAIARAKQNQDVANVVIPRVASSTPRKGLIGTNIG
jgi:hypothetical protein